MSEIQDLRNQVAELLAENARLLHRANLAQTWARTHYKALKRLEGRYKALGAAFEAQQEKLTELQKERGGG